MTNKKKSIKDQMNDLILSDSNTIQGKFKIIKSINWDKFQDHLRLGIFIFLGVWCVFSFVWWCFHIHGWGQDRSFFGFAWAITVSMEGVIAGIGAFVLFVMFVLWLFKVNK